MKKHDATYDFPEYKPHITLSYDIGDLDEKNLPDIGKYVDEIGIDEEYGEDLDLNWAKNKGVKKGN
jgi:2'-5' RNA ligase